MDATAASFENYFQSYAEAFNRFDAEVLGSFFHCPCLLVSTGSAALLATPESIRANTEALLSFHRSQGFARASFEKLKVQALAPNLAVVDIEWFVQRSDGTMLWSFRNTYNLGDFGNGWKILVSTTHGETG